jgi:hypothetical protein
MCVCEIDIIKLCMRSPVCILCSFVLHVEFDVCVYVFVQRTAVRTGLGIPIQHCVGGHLQGYRLGLGTLYACLPVRVPS